MGPVYKLLPDSLVLQIILFAGNAHPTTLNEWKANLAYAAVRRQWRQVAIDTVYNTAILEPRKTHAWWIKQLMAGPSKTVSKYEWVSNIDLIAATRNGQRAIELRIWLPAHERGIPAIHSELAELGLGSFFWSGIRTLHISNCIVAGCKDREGSAGDVARQTEIVDFFAKHVPLVSSLSLPVARRDHDSMFSLCEKITNHYARNLWFLSNPNTTVFAVFPFSNSLTTLSVGLPSFKPFWLPRLNITTIQCLRLTSVPHDFAWIRILPDRSRDNHEFACLNSLYIEYSEKCELPGLTHRHDDRTSFELQFPVLKKLTILNCPASGTILASCFDLPAIDEISVSGDFAGLEKLGNLCYTETASKISIDLRVVECSDMLGFYAVSNDLFGSIIPAAEMRLSLHNVTFTVDACHIEWFNLTHLAFHKQVALSTVASLVPMLPNLAVLYVGWLELDVAVFVELGSLQKTPAIKGSICPMDTRIQTLFVYASACRFVMDPVLFLAASMPTLKTLHVPSAFIASVQANLKCLVKFYAHLSCICVDDASKCY